MKKTKHQIDTHLDKMALYKRQRESLMHISKVKKSSSHDVFLNFNGYDEKYQEAIEAKDIGLESYLKENKLPSDILFHSLGPEYYYNITHDKSSPYSIVYNGDIQMLLDMVSTKSEYIKGNIIDIGCGDGIKLFSMLDYGLMSGKIKGTISYVGLDDSQDMLNFAKDNFYKHFYVKDKNKGVVSDNIHQVNKKIHPWFKKSRFQNIEGLENMSSKTIMFLGGTFGNLGEDIQKLFLHDIKKILNKDDVFVLSYFRTIEEKNTINFEQQLLIDNFFTREKQRYEDSNVYYKEKEKDIANFKQHFPGIEISHDDFDLDMELDRENEVLYDIRTFKKDIVYQGAVLIPKGFRGRSEGTKIDRKTLEGQCRDKEGMKHYVEALYNTKQTDDFIHAFMKSVGVDPKDYFIEVNYNIEENTLYINLHPLQPITFKWKEDGEEKELTKFPGEVINIHKSGRFTDGEIHTIVTQCGLDIVDEFSFKDDLKGQPVMKLLVIKNSTNTKENAFKISTDGKAFYFDRNSDVSINGYDLIVSEPGFDKDTKEYVGGGTDKNILLPDFIEKQVNRCHNLNPCSKIFKDKDGKLMLTAYFD